MIMLILFGLFLILSFIGLIVGIVAYVRAAYAGTIIDRKIKTQNDKIKEFEKDLERILG